MLIVTHIPKTAGTTLRIFLWKHYVPECRKAIGDDIQGDMRKLVGDPKAVEPLKVLFGHICWGWHSMLGVPPIYTTILREPLQRAYSLYNYIRRSKNHYLWQRVHGKSFEWFMNSGVTQTADNAMVRQLCGDDRFVRRAKTDMLIPFGAVTKDHFKTALDHMLSYMLVGVMERYQQYQDRMCEIMEWPTEMAETHNVFTRVRPEDAEPYRDVVMPHLKWDYVLYEEARKMAP